MKTWRFKMERQELVDFLLTVDKQHVSDLIDIITDFGKGRITLNSTVKNVLIFAKESNRPFTKKEIDLLLIEFQKYGGNTFANIFRNKENLVSYNEILNDVFNKNFNNLSTGGASQLTNEEKEGKIVQTLFSNNWEFIPFSERYKKSINIKNIILMNVTGGAAGDAFVNWGLKIFTRGNPAAFTANLALDFAAPALCITIPFIAQIAWIKMMNQNQQDKHEIKPVKILSSQDLIVADTDNKDVILSLTEYAEPPKIKNEFNLSNISVFNQLFSNIPTLATKFETARNHIVSINIDPRKLTPAKDGDGLRGMIHGYNEDGHFGITENVRIFEADTLKELINSGVILNLASTVVAQKHLADINERLKEIQKGIDDIKKFLINERHSKIDATIKLIESLSNYIAEYGQESPIFNETKDRLKRRLDDNLAIKLHLEKDLDDACNEISSIKFNSKMGLGNDSEVKSMIEQMKKWRKNYESYQLCCNVVMMTYALLYANNSDESSRGFYARELKNLVNDTDKFISKKIAHIQKHLQQAHENAKGITNFESSDLAYEALFGGCVEDFKFHQQELSKQLTQIATSVTTPMPFKATLLIENGKIQGGQFLLD